MPNIIIKTKINAPTLRRNLVSRKRLLPLLLGGVKQGHKLTFISAPAGFGKTTLVSEWLETSQTLAAWISLDEGDSDPVRFLTYLIAALQNLISGIGDSVLAALQSSQPVSPKELLSVLLNELASVEYDFILVLDDLHAIDTPAVDELLGFLVEYMPPAMHLVITTREDPALPLARLRARNQLTEIRAADLRFTESEAADFLNQVMGLNLSAENIAVLEKHTEGWVAGLQLAALSIQGHASRDVTEFIRSFSGANQFVLDYLLEEVLKKQPEALQSFLLCTSVLNRLNNSLCDALLQIENESAQETLETLERNNLFVIALDHERRWYRYHHLFRDLLRQRLHQKYDSDEIAKMHIRASEWFEREGDVGEAFHHAISAADFERAARLLESNWLAMDENFQTGAWLGWANQLPLSVRRVRPVLLTQMGWSYTDAGSVEVSESILQEAEACLKLSLEEMVIVEDDQFKKLPAQIAIARSYNAQAQNRFSDTVKYAEMAQDLTPFNDEFMQTQASAIASGAYWAGGELEKSFALMSNWAGVAQQVGNIPFAVGALFAKADILIDMGHLHDAAQVYETALSLAAVHGAEQLTAHHHLGLGLLHHEAGEDESAAQHLQKAFELGRHSTIQDWLFRKSLAQAFLKKSEGDYEAALSLFDEAKRFYVRTPIPNLRPVDAIKARIYLKQNRLDKAQAWADQCKVSLQDPPDYLHEFERLTLARIALAEYQTDGKEQRILDVLEALSVHLNLAKKQNRLQSQIEILLLEVFAYRAKGETAQAMSALEQALKLAEPEGYLRLFANEGKPMLELLATIKDARFRQYVNKILASFTLKPSTFPPQSLIDPLSERELEVLRFIADGLSNQEIAEKLYLSLHTVKIHARNIYAKLGVNSRTQAVARGKELGLL